MTMGHWDYGAKGHMDNSTTGQRYTGTKGTKEHRATRTKGQREKKDKIILQPKFSKISLKCCVAYKEGIRSYFKIFC